MLWNKQSRLRCLGKLPGADGFAAFASDAFTVQPGFKNKIERVGRKSKLMLRDGQTAAVSFHGVW